MKIKFITLTFILFCFLFIQGCSNKNEIDNIMSKPKLTSEQQQISDLIKKFIPKEGRLTTPLYGDYQKSIEYVDLDGDKKDEVIVFLKVEGKELFEFKIQCLILKQSEDKWDKAGITNNNGNSFKAVVIKDIDNDGKKEIILTYKIDGSTIDNTGIYKEEKDEYKEILAVTHFRFVSEDLDMDGLQELVVFNDDKNECVLYKGDNGNIIKIDEIPIDLFYEFTIEIQNIDKNHKGIILKAEDAYRLITVKNNKLEIIN